MPEDLSPLLLHRVVDHALCLLEDLRRLVIFGTCEQFRNEAGEEAENRIQRSEYFQELR